MCLSQRGWLYTSLLAAGKGLRAFNAVKLLLGLAVDKASTPQIFYRLFPIVVVHHESAGLSLLSPPLPVIKRVSFWEPNGALLFLTQINAAASDKAKVGVRVRTGLQTFFFAKLS